MPATRTLAAGLGAAAAALVLAGNAHAAAYFEDFPNDTGTFDDLLSDGWKANEGATGNVFDTSNTVDEEGPTNAFFSGPDGEPGILAHRDSDTRFRPWIFWTEEQPSFGELTTIDEISFALRNSHAVGNPNGSDFMQFAIRVGSNWYVTDDEFLNGNSSNWQSFSFGLDDVAWNTLNFVSGTNLGQGGATSLPAAGTVTGIGLYIENLTSAVRIDKVEVTLIPEPASLSLLAAGGLLLARRR